MPGRILDPDDHVLDAVAPVVDEARLLGSPYALFINDEAHALHLRELVAMLAPDCEVKLVRSSGGRDRVSYTIRATAVPRDAGERFVRVNLKTNEVEPGFLAWLDAIRST